MCTACLHMSYILVQECKEGIYEVCKSFSNYYCASFEHDYSSEFSGKNYVPYYNGN